MVFRSYLLGGIPSKTGGRRWTEWKFTTFGVGIRKLFWGMYWNTAVTACAIRPFVERLRPCPVSNSACPLNWGVQRKRLLNAYKTVLS